MKKLSVIGLDTKKEKVFSRLMELGVVQITEFEEGLKEKNEENISSDKVLKANNSKITELDNQISDVSLVLETLEQYSKEKEPLFFTRRLINKKDFVELMKKKDSIMGNVRGILRLKEELHKLQEEKNKNINELSTLRPWLKCDLPLDLKSTKFTDIEMGIVPTTINLETLKERVFEISESVYISEVSRDKDFVYLSVLTMKDDTEEVMTVLKQSGFNPVSFRYFRGTAKESQILVEKAIASNIRDIKKVEAKFAGRYPEKWDIECLHDELVMQRDKELAKNDLIRTKMTFSFQGWLPEKAVKKVLKILEHFECYYEVEDPKEDDKVPVLLQNGSFSYPFESVTDMYSLPDYRGIDPTSLFSAFYAIFFGIMLSDAGYGIVITIATFIILRKFKIEGMTYKMVKMFFFCGISTVFWGALFGGWFGDFPKVVGKVIFGTDLSVKPIWFDPIKDPITLLIFSLALGIIHMFIGMGIKAYMLIKNGKILDAVSEVFSWYLVIIGGVLMMAGGEISESAITVGKVMAILGAIVLLTMGGRGKKGIGRVLGGFGALYNITGYASDILSYSRLLALGLATGVIAQVVNTIGSLAGPGILGTILLLVTFVIGHTFNLGINALGAFVHTSRLQYIEFFGKFYEDGGEEFEPFKKNTKYIRLVDNNMEVKND